jgi:diguanylate cyclase (GGDEF)-like protein
MRGWTFVGIADSYPNVSLQMPDTECVEWHSSRVTQAASELGCDGLGPTRRPTFRTVLAIAEFRALFIAHGLSVLGDQLARIAIAWIVFERSHSTLLTGISYAVTYLPWLIGGPTLSIYADRQPRRKVMVICDVARAILLAVAAIPMLPTTALIVLATLIALLEPPFSAARAALIPDVVGEGEEYTVAAVLGTSMSQLAVVAGFLLGGALVAVTSAHGALLVDAATFLLSALVALRLVRHRPAVDASSSPWWSEVRRGSHIVFADRRLRWLAVASWIVTCAVISTEGIAVPYAHRSGHGAFAAGVLTAAAPLGMVLGGVVVGRVFPRYAERLMLPMAVSTPALLGLTAFDPPLGLTFFIWLCAGIASSMTLTANRVFVISVPRELRGRAFGIAAAGISGAQGIGTLAVGALAAHTTPGNAVADVALPALALIVIFSAASASFSHPPHRPIQDELPKKDEEEPMAAPRASQRRVWALNALLAIGAACLAPMTSHHDAYANIHLGPWWVLGLFLLGFAYPLRFEYRQQSWMVYLETVPLVLGLLFLSPLTLLLVRTGAVALTYLLNRRQLIRNVFNTASYACHTLVAIGVFWSLAPNHHAAHPAVWPAVFASVLASELVSWSLVALVVGLTDSSWQLRQRLRSGAIGTAVGVVMAFLALAMAASLAYDSQTAWAITVFVVLSIAGLQTYHRIADRAAALDRLYVVARELSPTTSATADLAPALAQLRRIIGADALELATPSTSDETFLTVVMVEDDATRGERTIVEERSIDDESAARLSRADTQKPKRRWTAASIMPRFVASDRLSVPVVSDDHVLGFLTAASDGATRPFERSDLRLLEAAADQIATALEKGRLIDSLRRAATLDALTGLANLESLRSFLDTSLQGSTGGVLVLLNLDRFREVNDMLGHEAGDAVLAEVARRLQSATTQGALFARVGGDQFAIAIPGAAGSEVARLAAMAVKSRVDGSLRLADVSADIRVTIGIARAPDHGNTAATLLRRAEMAMAVAKGSSSGIGEWEPDYERDGSRRLQLLTGLRTALSDGSLRVQYQPKFRLNSGEIVGFEALVRWTHPELGPISPAEFVPLAEATGLISALTSTVLRQALTACRVWHDTGKPVGVAVNVSARSLHDSVLVGQVAAMLTASGLEPRWLTLEITESSVMEDHSRSIDVLRELRMLGVRLSIDDFGTGYSSLHQLRGLPVHEVKIDRSFVETVDTDEADRAVVRAVVELCDSLGLATVAEGVEKASQTVSLEALGVAEVQGYFHGRPMDADAATTWLVGRPTATLAYH